MNARLLDHERGTAVIETVLVVPLIIVLLCFIVFVGRLMSARNDISAATRDAARAATLQRDARSADRSAHDTLAQVLDRTGTDCATTVVHVDTTHFDPGGYVRVDTTCTLSLADIAPLAIPGTKTLTAHATEPIDQYRAAP